MPDEKVRRVLDRNKLAILSGKVQFLEEEWRRHKHICADCGLHDNVAQQGCDPGWETATQLARAKSALLRYTEGPGADSAQDSGRLF